MNISSSRKSSSSSIGSLFNKKCNMNVSSDSSSSSSSDGIEIIIDDSYSDPIEAKTHYYKRRKQDEQPLEAFGLEEIEGKNEQFTNSTPTINKRKVDSEHRGYKYRSVSTSTSKSSSTININASTQSSSFDDQPSTSSGIYLPRYRSNPIPAKADNQSNNTSSFNSTNNSNNQNLSISINTNHHQHHQNEQSSSHQGKKRNYHQHHHHQRFSDNDYYNSESFKPKYTGEEKGYPGPKDYPWPEDHYPAPKPLSTDHLDESREIFFKARKDVENVNLRVKEERKLYHNGILEKIYLNIIESPRVMELDVELIPKGLGPFHVSLPDLHQTITNISCNLCEHITIDPVKCTNCSSWYCKECIKWLRKVLIKLNIKKPDHPSKCVCLLPDCLVQFAAKDDYPAFVTVTDGPNYVKYQQSTFTCRRNFCHQTFSPSDFSEHEKYCRRGLIADDYFFNLTNKFVHGETIKKQAAEPSSLFLFCPGHLKPRLVTQKTDPMIYNKVPHKERYYSQHYQLACVLVEREENPNDPELAPHRLRNHVPNLGIKFGEAERRLKDPTLPISESEEFLQSLGVPPVLGPRPDPNIVKPRMFKWNSIPDYLIKYSAEWAKLAGRYEYPHQHEYQNLPRTFYRSNTNFVCCDPFKLINDSEHEEIEKIIKLNFPSVKLIKRNDSTDLNRREQNSITSSSLTSSSSSTPSDHILALREKRQNYNNELFSRITTINIPKLPVEFEKALEAASKSNDTSNLDKIFSIHMTYVGVLEEYEIAPYEYREKVKQRPCWIVIVNGLMQIVYETLVGYKSVEEMNTSYHGLTYANIRRAKSLQSIKDQVIQFLVIGNQLIGTNLAMQFTALGLSKSEINYLRPKMREITQHFSPYQSIPCSLSLIAFLVLKGFTMKQMTHSPAVEAYISMQLYIIFKEEIENKCEVIGDGIHNRNMDLTCGNRRVANVLEIYSKRVANNQAEWPLNWSYYSNPRRRTPPKFDSTCAPPDKSNPIELPEMYFEVQVVDDEEELIDSFNNLSHFPWEMKIQKYHHNQN